jgi:hypothetical protein
MEPQTKTEATDMKDRVLFLLLYDIQKKKLELKRPFLWLLEIFLQNIGNLQTAQHHITEDSNFYATS